MRRARYWRSGALIAGAASLLTVAALTAAGASAQVTTSRTSQAASACPPEIRGPARVGHFGGIARPDVMTGCVQTTNDPAIGTPPLRFHGGPVMGTQSTGPVVVTPIFWSPAGHLMAADYKSIITGYLRGVAADSGKHSNVFSTLTQYFGSNGDIRYQVRLGAPINDFGPLPANGCTVAPTDFHNIYEDRTGYNACLDDAQVVAETHRLITSRGLPQNLAHVYVMFLPKHVEACFFPGSTTTAKNACTINFQPSAAFCAYHSMASGNTVYANLPFPIYASPVGFTCGSDSRGNFPAVQSPNGNPNADVVLDSTSHEIMEAITDPNVTNGWFDSSGFENGDECSSVYGSASGLPGVLYNQVIDGKRYLTQEEFSNIDFRFTGGGCMQAE